MRWVWLLALIACSSSSKSREEDAHRLLARVRGTTIFGPSNEYVPSPLKDIGNSAMYPVRAPEECEIALLPGGEDSFAARMALLARAKHSIRIEALIFTGDESGLRVADVLKRKHAEGVDVRVIVDSINSLGSQTQSMLFDLKQHGVEVEGYEAFGLEVLFEIPIPWARPYTDRQHPNMRYHEKLWIIDAGTPSAEVVTGGLNIANEYFRVDPANVKRYWRDQDVLVRGKAVDDLTAMFDRNWAHFKEMDRRRGNITDLAWKAARAFMDQNGRVEMMYERRDDLVKTVAAIEKRTVPNDYQATRCRVFQARPRLKETFIQQAYMKMLDGAKREVLIANAYFLPTVATRLMIKEAAQRCVRVVILSNGKETSDTPGMNVLARGYYKELLSYTPKGCKTGVEIWEWMGKKPSDATQTQGLFHAKYAIVDRRIGFVGSHNLDPRSERLNSESGIAFENTVLAEQLTKLFDADLATSRRISLEEAATFERPASARKRLEKDLAAALLEDNL